MAISGGDGSIILTTKVDETGLKKGLGSMGKTAKSAGASIAKSLGVSILKSFIVIGTAAAATTAAITKMAVSAYADYEQLVGGVETLFKGSAQKVIDYANDAFATAGMSANQYMEQVIGISAMLIKSTGDTEKAADVANMAITDMADNVNKMGTDMTRVQMAYQGFARQQYVLLDNLAIGYGGTKQEMERLLRDAQAITGVKYDINNLADVYSAIHAIQEELGITGTTAKEAEKTITGSANMMKAAWQNVLSAIAGGGDLDRAINNLVYSISKYFQNIVPVVQRSLVGIGNLIEQVAPMLVQNVASALIQAIPSLLNAVYLMIIGLAKGIWEGIKALFSGGSGSVTADIKTSVGGIASSAGEASTGIEELGNATEKAGKKAKKFIAPFDEINSITSDLGSSATGSIPIENVLSEMTVNTPESNTFLDPILEKVKEVMLQIGIAIKEAWSSEPVQSFVNAVVSYGKLVFSYWGTLGNSLIENSKTTWTNIDGDLLSLLQNMTSLWTLFWQNLQYLTDTYGPQLTSKVNQLFNSIWTTAIDPFIQFASKAWSDFTGILLEKWQENGRPLMDNIGEFAQNVIDDFQSIYDNILEPIITPFLEGLNTLWDENLSEIIGKVADFILKLTNGALEIYNKFIHPIIKWLTEKLKPNFEWIGTIISETFVFIFGNVFNTVGNIFDVLNSLVDFIVDVFTGDWEKAWEGIASIFKGIINHIIYALNGFISGINKIKFDVPEWVPGIGGKQLGFNIPKIPKLAQGAVIPPNREFAAILGDNKREPEIVSPLSTMKQAVAEVLAQVNVGGGGFNGRIEVPVIINGREIARAVRESEQDMGKQTVFGGFANAY